MIRNTAEHPCYGQIGFFILTLHDKDVADDLSYDTSRVQNGERAETYQSHMSMKENGKPLFKSEKKTTWDIVEIIPCLKFEN